MNEHNVSLEDLIAYADGLLDVERSAEVERCLSIDDQLRQQLQSIQTVRQHLTTAWQHADTLPLPKQRMWATIQRNTESRTCWRQILSTALCLLASLIVLLLAGMHCLQGQASAWQEHIRYTVQGPMPNHAGSRLSSFDKQQCAIDIIISPALITHMKEDGMTLYKVDLPTTDLDQCSAPVNWYATAEPFNGIFTPQMATSPGFVILLGLSAPPMHQRDSQHMFTRSMHSARDHICDQ